MIAIVDSAGREGAAFASLCESRRWAYAECDSVRVFRKFIRHTRVRVVLVRHRLSDGYSDDVIAALAETGQLPFTKIIVLLASTGTSSIEARQVKIGACCVLRDPVRTEVLLEYLAQFREAPTGSGRAKSLKLPGRFVFAGAEVDTTDRRMHHAGRVVRITPREIELMEALLSSEGQVVSYHNLFSEILGQRFRGNTSNLRVLLSLLDTSARKAGIPLRRWVEVIPKLGYRYGRPAAAPTAKPSKASRGKIKGS